jgi:hypothetical protein
MPCCNDTFPTVCGLKRHFDVLKNVLKRVGFPARVWNMQGKIFANTQHFKSAIPSGAGDKTQKLQKDN